MRSHRIHMVGPFWWLPFMCRLVGGHRFLCDECMVPPGTPTFECPEHCIRCSRCGTWRGTVSGVESPSGGGR